MSVRIVRISTINVIMKVSAFPQIIVALLLSGSVFFVGCSDPQKQAGNDLKAKGYEVTVKDLLVAASAGDVESIELFTNAGIDIDTADSAGNTALIKAASAGQIAAVEKILGMGADPRHTNTVGRDALISAASKGYEDVARMLLNRGADTSIRDSEGWGALSISAYNGHAGVVSLLSANATSPELDDALLVASFTGQAKVINTLLGKGANINARSPESKTPLMIASEVGKIDAVRVLLQNRANPYAVDLNNQTAANLAQVAGFGEVTKLITTPDSWGTSEEGMRVAGEMKNAQAALAGLGVEEMLVAPPAEPDAVVSTSPSSESGIAPADAPGVTDSKANQSDSLAGSSVPTVAQASVTELSVSAPAPSAQTSSVQESRQLREDSRSKPIVALNGTTIHSRVPESAPVKSMVLAAYHEESLPIVVDHVDGSKASMRRLDQSTGATVEVAEGAVIPGTNYKVQEVTIKFVSSKEGKGRMVDVSRVKVEDTQSGATHLLVKDVSGQTSDTYAILVAPNSQYRYVVKAGDVFRTTQPDIGTKDYQVLDIRPTGVVIKDLATEEVVTVARDGVVNP
jgi:type IV pilus biogenesis protein PilP